MNVRVVSRVAERLKERRSQEIKNFRKIPEMLGFDDDYQDGNSKDNF